MRREEGGDRSNVRVCCCVTFMDFLVDEKAESNTVELSKHKLPL